jgi:hypothetical protein
MADIDVKAFPFLSLPAELRNKIYKLLLCSFVEPTTSLYEKFNCRMRTISTGSIDTAILRTSTQVHREAYDVMVKTNRLVQVIHPKDPDLVRILKTKRVPIVLMSGRHYQGYSMRITLTFLCDLGTPLVDSDT